MSNYPQRALIVAFHYPPDNTSTGVLRTLKFTQYLVDHGWDSDVLSVPSDLYWSVDAASCDKIPISTRVFRTWAADTKSLFGWRGLYPTVLGVPDRYWPWIIPAVRKGGELIRKGEVSVIFTTYPVPSALLIGRRLKAKYGLPWVADFRDPWVEDSMPAWRRRIECQLEKKVVTDADRVICNTPRMKKWFIQRYPKLDPDKFVTIPNGYDETDLASVKPQGIPKFEIIYTGIIAPGNRNPQPLFAGLRYAIDQGWIDANDVQVTFLGAGSYGRSREFLENVEKYRLAELVMVREDRIPYASALSRVAGADVVLVLSEPIGNTALTAAERQWSHLQVPVKVYEGLGLGCQILALVSDGAVKDILGETQAGLSVSPADTEGVAKALKTLYESRNEERRCTANARLKNYSRKRLAGELAAVFDSLTHTESTGQDRAS